MLAKYRMIRDFIEGFYKGFHYTYVDKGFWYEAGYALSYALSGWYDEFFNREEEGKHSC